MVWLTVTLEKYVNDIEYEISSFGFTDKSTIEDNFKYENLQNKLSYSKLKLEKMKSNSKETLNKTATTSSPNLCQIGFSQAYEFGASGMLERYFKVTSSYPQPPGPLPPPQPVTIRARSYQTVVDLYGTTQYLSNFNSYTGSNVQQGSISATTSFNLNTILHNPAPTWSATSIISKGNCFGYIQAHGTW